jgi:hypothetical protein
MSVIIGSDDQGSPSVGRCIVWVRLRLEQDVSAALSAKFGSDHQGGPAIWQLNVGAVRQLSVHDGASLEQDMSNLLVAMMGSDHQGGHAASSRKVMRRVYAGCHIWVRLCLEQDGKQILVASLGSHHQQCISFWVDRVHEL